MDSIILTAISFALVLFGVWFVLVPLFEEHEVHAADPEEFPSSALKERYFLQLEELESDYRSEKIGATEYQELREELIARLAEILATEQDSTDKFAATHSRSE